MRARWQAAVLAFALVATSGRALAQPPPTPADSPEEVLKALSFPVTLPGATLWTTVLTDASVAALWHGMAAEDNLRTVAASGGTVFYLVGVAGRNFDFAPGVTIVQGGREMPATLVNIHSLGGGTVIEGETMIGLIEAPALDLRQPFVLRIDGHDVKVRLAPAAIDCWGALAPPKPVFRAPEPVRHP